MIEATFEDPSRVTLVDRATEVNIINNSVASLLGVSEEDGALNRVGKSRALDKNLGTHAGVDTREQNAVPVVVDDVHGGEADKGLAAADVLPVVVGVVSSVGDVEQTIQIVLSSAQITRKIAVVDPNICYEELHSSGDERKSPHRCADDGLVRRRANAIATSQFSGDDDGKRFSALGSFNQSSDRSDGDGLAFCTTGGTAVLGAVSNAAGFRCLALEEAIAVLDG
ncbi:hypothetical protein HG530_001242 [Fusarium avenaceum]|nr:hypothetical protein HG530_001242 [Fusarium avenaceum]